MKIDKLSDAQKNLLLFIYLNSENETAKHFSTPFEGEKWSKEDHLIKLFNSALYCRRLISLDKLEAFLGEKYNFEEHIRPMIELDCIYVHHPKKDSFYDSESYREIFKHTTGLCKNYDSGEVWLAFFFPSEKDNFISEKSNLLLAKAKELKIL